MKHDALERLVIDRCLGELNDDSAHLLDAYLNLSPEDAAAVRDVPGLLALARNAQSPVAAAPMPPLKARAAAQASPRQSVWSQWARPIAAAAVVVLAFYSGTRFAREAGLDARTPLAAVQGVKPAAASPDFWSIRNFATQPSTNNKRPGVVWTSPVDPPRLGENL